MVAGGIDVIYPPENEALQAAIGERGVIVSEMVPGTVPRAEHFPRRNRIISGLSRALIVVEEAADAAFNAPADFEDVERRRYDDTEVVFLRTV